MPNCHQQLIHQSSTRLVRFYDGQYGNCIRIKSRYKAKGMGVLHDARANSDDNYS